MVEDKESKYMLTGSQQPSWMIRGGSPSQYSRLPQPTDVDYFDQSDETFHRQDSLAMCSELVEDGNPLFDDMEDLSQYVPIEGFGEDMKNSFGPMIEKQTALFRDAALQYGSRESTRYAMLTNCDNAAEMASAEDTVSYAPDEGYGFSPSPHFHPIKEESLWEDQQELDALVPGPSKPSESVETVELPRSKYVPQIKPRKYKLKSEAEKKNKKYWDARARNNDAVRRSRMKKRKAEQEKENELERQKKAKKATEDKLAAITARCAFVEDENRSLRKQNEELKHQLGHRCCQCSLYRRK